MEPRLCRIVPNLHMRATICLPRELIREPMKDLDPEGLPRAHLRGTRRVTTIPMTTTVTADLNEANLVGRRLRYTVGVGREAKVKEKMRVVPRVVNDLLGRVHRGGTPEATIVIVGAGVVVHRGQEDGHRPPNLHTIDSTRLMNDYDYLRV